MEQEKQYEPVSVEVIEVKEDIITNSDWELPGIYWDW